MSEVLVGTAVGAAVAVVLWLALRGAFSAPIFVRANHRGVRVPVGAGVVLVGAALVAAATEAAFVGIGVDQRSVRMGDGVLLAAVGFGLLGLFDDLGESGDHKGFAGHLSALRAGRLTTGGLKLLGGGVLAVAITGARVPDRPGQLVVDALLVALAANLGNLLDRAPGRVVKVAVVGGAVLLLTHLDAVPHGVPVVLGAALGLAWFDLREQLMLGDAGANVLGAVLGLGVVLSCAPSTRLAVLVVVALLNLLSERVSFSAVIDRVGPLRAIDRLGRHDR